MSVGKVFAITFLVFTAAAVISTPLAGWQGAAGVALGLYALAKYCRWLDGAPSGPSRKRKPRRGHFP